MPSTPDQLLARLDELGIAHTTHEHPPVFTVEEAQAHTAHLPGGHCKSLFLKDKKGGLWLLICLDHRRIDMNRLASVLGSPRFSFGRAELLEEVLGVTPGSVTPFALVNDRQRRVQPLIDRAMLAHDRLNYHPLINTRTTTIAASDLIRFIESCGHRPRVLDLDGDGIDRGGQESSAPP
ncbi:MAG TPA: prolyl-tRNA synthetase associated domain-containing protein [Geminicoccaceae bacterium]